MNSDKKNKVGLSRTAAFVNIDRIHPIRMLLYLSMAGMLILFMMLTVAYGQAVHYNDEAGRHIPFPKFFSISTLILFVSSYLITKISKAYRRDNILKLRKILGFVLLSGFAFIGAQLLAWNEIAQSGIFFTSKSSSAFVYLISAIHLLHLTGGLIFLIYLFFKTSHVATDAVRTLIFIRDPFRLLQMQLITIYWHFLGGVWLGVYILFLFRF
jgi:cytochrome c oxidase subunit III